MPLYCQFEIQVRVSITRTKMAGWAAPFPANKRIGKVAWLA